MEHERSGARQQGLPPGTPAPDFTLRSTPDQVLSLRDFRGRNVVLVFYPADFSPGCTSEVTLFNELVPELREHDAVVLGISVDSPWSHLAFARERKLRFQLLADFEPKGAVSREYGVYRPNEGVSERALFVIDGNGVIRFGYVSPIGVNPGAEGVLAVLEALDHARQPKEMQSDRNTPQPALEYAGHRA